MTMNVLKHVDNHMDDLILDLQKLIQQELADLVCELMTIVGEDC